MSSGAVGDDASSSSPPPTSSSSSSGNAQPMSLDALQQEYDSYKLKTREWQAKVRDRDIKMRQQLQQSTNDLQDREKQLDALSKRILELEHELGTVTELRARVADLEEANAAAVRDATRSVKQAMEEEVAERQREVLKLRGKVANLEERLDVEQRRAKGLHLLPSSSSESTSTTTSAKRPMVDVIVRIAVPGHKTFCFCQPAGGGGGEGAWIDEQLLVDRQILLPATVHEAAEKEKDAISAQLKSEHEKAISQVKSELLKQISELEEKCNGERAKRAVAEEKVTASEKLHAEEPERVRVAVAEALKAAAVEAQKHVKAAVEEERAKQANLVGQLQSQVRALEEYKVKAQLAMKSAAAKNNSLATATATAAGSVDHQPLATAAADAGSGSSNDASAPSAAPPASASSSSANEQQLKAITAKFSKLCADFEDERRVRIEAEDRCRQLVQVASISVTLQKLEESHREEAELLARELREVAQKWLTLAEKHLLHHHHATGGAEVVDGHRLAATAKKDSSTQVDSTLLPTAHEPPRPSPEIMRRNIQGEGEVAVAAAALRVANGGPNPSRGSSGGGGSNSNMFDFSEMLQAHNSDLITVGAAAKRRDSGCADHSGGLSTKREDDDAPQQALMVALLRREIRDLQDSLHRAQAEVRDATLTEQKSIEQSCLLKEQIRELERRIAREKDFVERSDYAKNVILKLLTSRDAALRRSLVPVVAEVLQLSPEERRTFAASV